MATDIRIIKRRLKRGPRTRREMRAEFALIQASGSTRTLQTEVLEKIRSEVERFAHSNDPRVERFVELMR